MKADVLFCCLVQFRDERLREPDRPLVLAGPGSGKTRVITEKILHLIDQGVPPTQILALTFSEKAATEMSERIEQSRPNLNLEIHTFHSFCNQMLRENVLASGISLSGGTISKTNQLVWGLRNIDAFGLECTGVGNNCAEVIRALISRTTRPRSVYPAKIVPALISIIPATTNLVEFSSNS